VKPVLVDSGFLVAVYKRRDAYHSLCMSVYEDLNRPLVSCEAVVTEALHLLRNTPGAGIALLSSIEQGLLALPLSLSRSAAKCSTFSKNTKMCRQILRMHVSWCLPGNSTAGTFSQWTVTFFAIDGCGTADSIY